MKVRKLQRRNEDDTWFDDAYVYEDERGQVIFCYNLAWEQMGSFYARKMQEMGITIEQVEMVIIENEDLRWLPFEIIDDSKVEAYLDQLDQACSIPYQRPEKKTLPV
ncbi:MAG: hypothetical protein AAF629_16575 [Chloroflexota bacterium]